MSSGKQKTVQKTVIPQRLKPLVSQQGRTAKGALERLDEQLSDAGADELVAPFTEDQRASFELAREAAGPGGAVPTALDTLQSTAEGDFLFGGEGFDAAVDAAMRQAQPRILSAFGGAGRGTGGLAQQAIGQAATDAFARQFSQERQRQLAAAQMLPAIAGQGVGLLGDIGAQQQQQAQSQLTAPITAEQQLLGAAGGKVPLQSLLGQKAARPNSGPSRAQSAMGGAATGAALGSAVPVIGTGVGAVAGGLLGAASSG